MQFLNQEVWVEPCNSAILTGSQEGDAAIVGPWTLFEQGESSEHFLLHHF